MNHNKNNNNSIQFVNSFDKNSKKLHLDKYYTSLELAQNLINKSYKIIGMENITEIIEPSAGNGSFSNQIVNCLAYDLEPESNNIVQQDFLKLKLTYKKGRLFIGNPPFGARMGLAQKFFKKCAKEGDYIAFILPISQHKNTSSLYEFDLVYSEDLGKIIFSDREIYCCFNIYKRPANGKLNTKKKETLKDISIIRQDSKDYNLKNFDLRMSYFGASAGKILQDGQNYCGEYKIIIHNNSLRNEIVKCLKNIDWHSELKFISKPKILQFHIYDILKKYVTGIK